MSSDRNEPSPRTSSRALQTRFEALGLQVELWGDASDDFEEVFEAVLTWYVDPERAKAARVFCPASSGSMAALRRELGIALGEQTRPEASHMRPPVLTLDEAGGRS